MRGYLTNLRMYSNSSSSFICRLMRVWHSSQLGSWGPLLGHLLQFGLWQFAQVAGAIGLILTQPSQLWPQSMQCQCNSLDGLKVTSSVIAVCRRAISDSINSIISAISRSVKVADFSILLSVLFGVNKYLTFVIESLGQNIYTLFRYMSRNYFESRYF